MIFKTVLVISSSLLISMCLTGQTSSQGYLQARQDSISQAKELSWQADEHVLGGRLAEADLLYKKALALAVTTAGPTSPLVGDLTIHIAHFYLQHGRLREAEHLFRRALVIASGLNPTISFAGEFEDVNVFLANVIQHPENLAGSYQVAQVLSGLAEVFAERNHFADAERLLKRAVAIYEIPENLDVTLLFSSGKRDELLLTKSLWQLADVYKHMGDANQAEKTLQKAVKITEKKFGLQHPYVADALLQLADFYLSENRMSEAEALQERAKQIKDLN